MRKPWFERFVAPRPMAILSAGGAIASASAAVAGERLWTWRSAEIGLFSSGSVTLLAISVALLLVDPLTRRHVRQQEERKWSEVGDAVKSHLKSSLQTLIGTCLLPLYSGALSRSSAAADRPEPATLMYASVRQDPSQYVQVASGMLSFVTARVDANLDSEPVELGKALQAATYQSSIDRAINRLERAAEFYHALPVRQPTEFTAVTSCVVAAVQYSDAVWATRAMADLSDIDAAYELHLGTLSLSARSLALASLKAYCSLCSLPCPVDE